LVVTGKLEANLYASTSALREQTCFAKPPDETVVRRDVIENFGKCRQRMESSQREGKLNQRLR